MHSRKAPNRRARTRHSSHPQAVTVPSECPGNVTIGKLSDEVLLNIFRYCLDTSPRFWPTLVHICSKWRHIVFSSQRSLHLRLFCTHGTPVLRALDCWPSLPLVLEYWGSPALGPPSPEDEDDILAALKRSDRVRSINLTVTRSLLEKLFANQEPFSELEELFILSRDNVQATLPSTFRWGPRLRRLHLTGIGFPSLASLQHLTSSEGLVDIRLHDISNSGFLSSKALSNTLSGMTHLQLLSLHFLSTTNHVTISIWSGERVILPALIHLDFRGDTGYLEDLLGRIDAPRLGNIEITFLDEPIFSVSYPLQFRIGTQTGRQADILFSEHSVSISLGRPGLMCLKLQVFCGPLSRQLSSIAQICGRFPAFLRVKDLHIDATRLSSKQVQVGAVQWLKLFRSFTGTKRFYVVGNESINVVRALQPLDTWHETVLPSLHGLYILQPEPRYAPLREAVVSLMVSRRLSGHPIMVEYEPLHHISQLRGTGLLSQQMTIEVLSDDVLLNIFRHCLHGSPLFWPTLTHVCQKWRRIVFASPLGLDLRLYCTYGTPVLKTLDYWPALPIILNYGGSPTLDRPTAEDEDNVMAALKHSDYVCSIGLMITTSLLAKLCAVEKSFSTLEELVLRSLDNVQLTLPRTLTWGPRLRTLHSTRIAFPALPQLLSSSESLVNLRLHEIPSSGYISPKALANALSGTTQLRSLSLHFLSPSSRPSHAGISPSPGERVVLPALTHLNFRGSSEYLNDLVTRIDAPHLGDIEVEFFNQLIFHIFQLRCFIDRIEIHRSHCRADILSREHAISITFTQPEARARLVLQISCEQLDWQLSSLAQICDQLSSSSFLFGVGDLYIDTVQSSSRQDDQEDDADSEQWPEVIHSFPGVERLSLAGKSVTNILRTLEAADRETNLLPALKYLCVPHQVSVRGYGSTSLLQLLAQEMAQRNFQAAIKNLVTPRQLSDRPIHVEYTNADSSSHKTKIQPSIVTT